MAAWSSTNERIRDCRQSADPERCLARLFDERHDGHVAFALAEVLERRGDPGALGDALEWYSRAETLYPLAKYTARARTARERVERRLRKPGSRLVIVGCTKHKVWDDDPSVPAYVPARKAYTGSSLPGWVIQGRDEPSGARWLFLSAKYGFIEPDHPIAAYDVTFSDPESGPISVDSLRAQVQHQVRWGGVPLTSFTEREVLAGPTYQGLVEHAFAAARGGEDLPAPAEQRARAVGEAIAALPPEVIDAIDRGEPEWRLLGSLAESVGDLRWLVAIALGLTDFQLSDGGAQLYWRIAAKEIDDDPPADVSRLFGLIERVLRHPVAAKDADKKIARIDRLLRSPIPGWLDGMTSERLRNDLPELWRRLAEAMNQDRSAKTIVFSVKLVDLMVLHDTGGRASLPVEMPIAVDIRIARASFASGILGTDGERAATMLRRRSTDLLADRSPYVGAWNDVARHTGMSALRLDSLIWQAAGHLRPGRPAADAQRSIAGMLVGYGAEVDVATQIANELTAALDDG